MIVDPFATDRRNGMPLGIGYWGTVAARGEGTNLLPSFQTSRLTLRQRTTADIEACLAMDRDPEVTRFMVGGPWADPVAHRAFVEARIHAAYPTGMGYWSVLASDRFVGWILLGCRTTHLWTSPIPIPKSAGALSGPLGAAATQRKPRGRC